jgi:hypothetical protein
MWVFSLNSRVVSRVATDFDDGRAGLPIHGPATARVDQSRKEHPAVSEDIPSNVGRPNSHLNAVGAPGSVQSARIGSTPALGQRNRRYEEVCAYVDFEFTHDHVLSACLVTGVRADEPGIQPSDETAPCAGGRLFGHSGVTLYQVTSRGPDWDQQSMTLMCVTSYPGVNVGPLGEVHAAPVIRMAAPWTTLTLHKSAQCLKEDR